MEEKLVKSESCFAFHIDGDNSIDAEILSNIINDMAQLTKYAVKEEDPEAYLKMNVTAFKNGSFEIDFSAICEVKDTLLNIAKVGIPLAASLVATVEGYLKIKKHIKGKKAKEVKELPNNKIQFTNNENETIILNKSSGTILNNVDIDQLVINISNNVYQHNPGGGFSLNNDTEYTHFDCNDIINLGKPVPINNIITYQEQSININLPIKKADMLGHSAWSFIYHKKIISAPIEDYDFLKKVHSGKLSVHAGDYINAILKISYQINQDNEPIEETTKYIVSKVIGEIKSDKNQIQLEFD